MVKPKYSLDYNLIKDQIDRLLESVFNKLEREWPKSNPPPSHAAFTVVVGTLQVVRNTFKTVRFLCSEKSADWRHKREMALATPPLARTILDALHTIVFLLEDLPTRSEWYMCSGWRELAAYIARAKRDYGSDPDWIDYVAQADRNLANLAKMIGKPDSQLRNSKWWPTPPQMKKIAKQSATTDFFSYLDDWFYREFSQSSHLSLPGLIAVAGALRDSSNEKTEQMRGYYFMQVVIILTSLYSELEAELKIGVASDLKYLWEMLGQHYPFAKEIYNRRNYASRIS